MYRNARPYGHGRFPKTGMTRLRGIEADIGVMWGYDRV